MTQATTTREREAAEEAEGGAASEEAGETSRGTETEREKETKREREASEKTDPPEVQGIGLGEAEEDLESEMIENIEKISLEEIDMREVLAKKMVNKNKPRNMDLVEMILPLHQTSLAAEVKG